MKRIILFGAMPLLMAGCVPLIPLPISIVTSGLSGISFLTTGKSTTDHVISAANKQDCVMHRVAFGEEICRNYAVGEYRPHTAYSNHFPGDQDQDQDSQVAETLNDWGFDHDSNTAELPEKSEDKQKIDPLLISSLTNPTSVTASVSMDIGAFEPTVADKTREISVGKWERPEFPIEVESAELPPLPRLRPSSESVVGQDADVRFLSLGSFRSTDRANALKRRYAFLSPTIMTIEVGGETWRRVAVGPLTKPGVELLRRSHSRIDGRETWSFAK